MSREAARRIPVFVSDQAQCDTCGRTIRDPLVLELYGRACSARCHHARGLPVRRGAG